jgi:DNA-binding transcriptional LysR family regulator
MPVTAVARTTCYMCACRCGIKVHLEDGKLRYIEGNRDHPVNRGVLCAKGSAGIMTAVSPARLTNPLKRVVHVPDLRADRFIDDEIVPVACSDHPLSGKKRLTPADLSGQPLLMRELGSGTRELVERRLQRHGVRPGYIVEFGNTEAIKQAAIHGGGIAWLPRVAMPRELAAGELVRLPVSSLVIRRPLSVIRRANGYAAPATEAFLQLLDIHGGALRRHEPTR